jgi:electron transfer flavoprotein beta subunit
MRIQVEYQEATGRLRQDWTITMLNPPDRTALETALKVKADFPGSHVTVIHIGPLSGEQFMRECLALGCDEGLRIWDEELGEIQPRTKALIFSHAAKILDFDLIFMGTKSQDTGNGQTGILLAARLGVPCIASAIAIKIRAGERVAEVTKRLTHGYHALIETPIPMVIGMETIKESRFEPSLSTLLEADSKDIPCWNLAEVGIPRQLIIRMDGDLTLDSLKFPRSKLRFIPAPDSSLPAFMRIRKLVEGTVGTREGRLVSGSEDQVIEELFEALLKEGWLDHLKVVSEIR